MTKHFLSFWAVLTFLGAGLESLRAAEAAYSKDGRWLFHLIRDDPKVVLRRDCQVLPSEQAAAGVKTVFAGELEDVARLSSGELAVASSEAIWRWAFDKGEGGIQPWLKAPEGYRIRWLAAGTEATRSSLLVICEPIGDKVSQPLWRVEAGASEMVPVSSRRVSQIHSLAFTDQERFVFSSGGDLWYGTIDEDKIDGKAHPVLIARRWLATAELETYSGTPSGCGAHAVACSGGRVFFDHSRMGGSGWGRILSVPAPVPPAAGEFDHRVALEDRLVESAKAAADLWEIDSTTGTGVQFASAPDGQETSFRVNGSNVFLPCEKPPHANEPKADPAR